VSDTRSVIICAFQLVSSTQELSICAELSLSEECHLACIDRFLSYDVFLRSHPSVTTGPSWMREFYCAAAQNFPGRFPSLNNVSCRFIFGFKHTPIAYSSLRYLNGDSANDLASSAILSADALQKQQRAFEHGIWYESMLYYNMTVNEQWNLYLQGALPPKIRLPHMYRRPHHPK
jgi:hypothetical protein